MELTKARAVLLEHDQIADAIPVFLAECLDNPLNKLSNVLHVVAPVREASACSDVMAEKGRAAWMIRVWPQRM